MLLLSHNGNVPDALTRLIGVWGLRYERAPPAFYSTVYLAFSCFTRHYQAKSSLNFRSEPATAYNAIHRVTHLVPSWRNWRLAPGD